MNREDFVGNIETTFSTALAIARQKNSDYGLASDPFSNFKNATLAGVSVDQGILVRTIDKITRLGNLLHKDAAVVDETVDDTIMDAINYLAILKAWRSQQ